MKDYVYSYGVISASNQIILEHDYPKPQGYAEVKESLFTTGGEAANSSVVLARLGLNVIIDGNWLGDDTEGSKLMEILNKNNIDTSLLKIKSNYRGVREFVVSTKKTRTTLGTYCKLVFGKRQWNIPSSKYIKKSKVINLDPFFGEESYKASEISRKHNKPVVCIDCKHDNKILKNTSILIIAESFINENYGKKDINKIFKEYQKILDGLLIFTFGSKAILYGKRNQSINKFIPNKIKPVDTTGAGDSFRAGIIYGLMNDLDIQNTLKFASSLSAMVCLSYPSTL